MLRYRIATKLIAPHLSVKTVKAESIFYDCDKQKMVVGKYFDPNDYGFMRHITNAHGFKEAPTYKYVFLHILHEIGHYMTEEKYGSNKEAQAWFKQNARIIRDNTHLQNDFYNYREEWEATEWAIKWIKAHPKKAKLLNALL